MKISAILPIADHSPPTVRPAAFPGKAFFFENAFSIALMRHVENENRSFLVEDESRNIGSRHIPPSFFARMEKAPLVLLEASFERRVEITLDEYVHDALAAFQQAHGQDLGFNAWADYLRNATGRIRRRLGGDRHHHVSRLLEVALDAHARLGDTEPHREWIAFLLRDYYDGMYEYQLSRKQERIAFSGDRDELAAYLERSQGIQCRPDPA